MPISPSAGKPAAGSRLVDVAKLVTAYFVDAPDPTEPGQRVAFGTSGHRGSAARRTFNEPHVLCMAQAICDYRTTHGIGGPLFLGIDTHALSQPAMVSTLAVLVANAVDVVVDRHGRYTPTPVISHAILTHNATQATRLADGIVISPSHNPPDDGGFKYNPPSGGPADAEVTGWIQDRANQHLASGMRDVDRMPYPRGGRSSRVHDHDYIDAYVGDLDSVIDMDAIRSAGVRIGVDPLGGAAVDYWPAIKERYGLDLTVVNDQVDATFGFMTFDWDGKIRMDPSSRYAMARLVEMAERFDVAVANDADADRHGVVTPGAGLLNPNHFLTAAVSYLLQNRPSWAAGVDIGKTVVTTAMLDRVAASLGRRTVEVPVGFKWFVEGLHRGRLGFAGEESAGASLLRRDGGTWTTDKDGIALALLAAEITARAGRDPGALYAELTETFGSPSYERVDAPATPAQKAALLSLSPDQLSASEVAGDAIREVLTAAPGNGAAIGGLKVVTENGWFAARPSGTEDVYKIYAESFRGSEHLSQMIREAQALVDAVLAGAAAPSAAGARRA